jgi:hypothetical protein
MEKENWNWNRNNKKLLHLTTEILDLLGQVAFMERWFLPYLQPSQNPVVLALADKSIDQISDRSVAEEVTRLANVLNSTRQRWREIINIMSAGMIYTMRSVDDIFPASISEEPCRRPSTLIRVWTRESYSPYSEDLGFRCSDWASCKRYAGIRDLLDGKVLTTESLRNHCEKKSRPSLWISFSDDASWILHYAQEWGLLRNPTCRVAIISVERLERCNIPWGRSNDLVMLTGGKTYSAKHPDGVKYAWSRQILVYGCVPTQCLVAKFTIQQFCELCRERNIRGMHLTLLAPANY